MKHVHLHIGLHKTGTTAIQTYLARNAELLERGSVLYPRAGRAGAGHHHLAWELLDDPRFDPQVGNWGETINEIDRSGCQHTMISAEDLCRLPREGIERPGERLRSFRVRILVSLRRQDHWLEGAYANALRGGQTTLDFDAFFERRRRTKRLDYEDLLARWSEIFGADAIAVRMYGRDFDPDFNSVSDLTGLVPLRDVAGLPPPNAAEASVNPGAGPRTLELLRLLNLEHGAQGLTEPDRRRARKHAQRRARELGWDEVRFRGLSREQSSSLLAAMASANARVARTWLGRPDAALFTSVAPPSSAPSCLDEQDLSEVRSLLIELQPASSSLGRF